MTTTTRPYRPRGGRPAHGTSKRVLISIRIDPDVLRALRAEASRKDIGYQTLINSILAGRRQSVARVSRRSAR